MLQTSFGLSQVFPMSICLKYANNFRCSNDRGLVLDRGTIGSANSYKCFGAIVSRDGSCENEIKDIGQGKAITKQLNGVLWSGQNRPENNSLEHHDLWG